MKDTPHLLQPSTLVQIFGDEYRLASELERGEIEQIAAFVDRKMREIARREGHRSRTDLAVLAALEIAAVLFRAQKEKKHLLQKTCESIDRLNRLVDQRGSLVALTSQWLERRYRPDLSRKLGSPAGEPVSPYADESFERN